MKQWLWQWGLPIAGYGIIIGIVFGQALIPHPGMMLYGDDIHRAYYFFREFFLHWLHLGIFPWWNPYIFGGQPFIADPVVNIWYPPNWLFVVLPLNTAYSWHIAFHVLWAMVGMGILIRRVLGERGEIGEMGAWIGGVVFGLSGFFMARTWAGHVDVIAAASWMPWVVWAFYRLLRAEVGISWFSRSQGPDQQSRDIRHGAKAMTALETKHRPAQHALPNVGEYSASHSGHPQRVALAACIFSLQLLAGYQTMAFMTVMIVAFVTSLHSYFERSWKPIIRVGSAGLLGVGLAAIQILPEQEFFRASIRTYSLPYSWMSYGSWTWKSLIQLLNPFYFGNQVTYAGPPPNFAEHSAFIGVGGVVLAIIGIIGVVGSFLRAEVGISWFSRSQGPDQQSRDIRHGAKAMTALETKYLPARLLGICFLCISLFGIWISLGPNAPIDLQYILWKIIPMYHYLRIPPRHLILVVFGLAGLAGIGFSRLPRSPRILRLLIGGMIIVEMVSFGRNFIELRPVPEARHDVALIRLFRSDSQPYRVLQNFGVWLPIRDAMDFDSVMPYGVFSATGYDPSILRRYYEYVAEASGKKGKEAVLSQDVQVPYVTPASADALDVLNIKYIMVPVAYDPFAGNSRYVLARSDAIRGFRVYENTTVKPRFFFAHASCGTAHVDSYTPNVIRISVDAVCADTLNSSEVRYPGWVATIDGKKVDMDSTNSVFRTLFVPLGKHTIVYTYEPTIFLWGGVISALTIGLLCGMYVFSRRR